MPRATVTLRFYAELNDFLAPARRGRAFGYTCARAASVKNAIEAVGVPHTEVELILVNGRSVDFGYRLADGDRVSVYPVFESFDIAPLLRVRARPLRDPRFVADAHLGGLARLLRMAGFDTLHEPGYRDDEIRALAAAGHRIVLTRDRELLKCRDITHGCYVRALKPAAQLREVVGRLQLGARLAPFTRCLRCNLPLEPAGAEAVRAQVPPAVVRQYARFARCPGCGRIYWEGGHWQRMRALLAASLGAADLPATGSPQASGP